MSSRHLARSKVTVTYDHPWPLDALSEESFERFCADFLQMANKGARVNRYGGRGHTQKGLDIDVQFPDGIVHTYQCKRHSEFGQKKIDKAVAAHTRGADKRHLLLSCIASPGAREAIKKYLDWELWDRDDISRRIRRDLKKAEQRILVDTYFAGQRQALIGELEPSPWQTPEKFFAGMMIAGRGFSHTWTLVGRSAELSSLVEAITVRKEPIVQIIGIGGSGKTRLIKAITDHILVASPGASIYVLSRDKLDAKSLEDLGDDQKLLICDDAHERDDIGLLFDYIAVPSNNAQLLIAYRQYGESYVKRQASILITDDTPTIRITNLNSADAEKLAAQALSEFGASTEHIKRLARYTRDCPLATIIGAQILSENRAIPEFLQGEAKFRGILMSRLIKNILDGISNGLNEDAVRLVLGVVALLQPIFEDDAALTVALAPIVNLSHGEVILIVKRLREAGVLFRRGRRSRIAPDLLGDFLIEDAYVSDSRSNGLAERIFEGAPTGYAENILVNLGRLDWRMSNGGARQSRILDALWSKLSYSETHVSAVAAVAYYQPEKSLRYAQRAIGSGKAGEAIVKILKNIAFNYEHLAEVCQLLWKLGQNDARPLHQHPWHGLRVLNDLGSPEPGKPLPYIEMVVDFSISLIQLDASWSGFYTPLDILEGALRTEGHTTTATSRALKLNAFSVHQPFVAAIRRKTADSLISLLGHANSAIGYKVAAKLNNLLRFPSGLFGVRLSRETVESWVDEFCETLIAINSFLDQNSVHSAVLIGVCESVYWHAFYAQGKTRIPARRIMARLDCDLKTRTVRMLMDGRGQFSIREDGKRSWQDYQLQIKKFVGELIQEFPNADDLLKFLKLCIGEVISVNGDRSAMHILIGFLVEASVELSELLAVDGIVQRNVIVSAFAGSALACVLGKNPRKAKEIISFAIKEADEASLLAVADSYSQYHPSNGYEEDDKEILRTIVLSKISSVLVYSATVIRRVAEIDKLAAVDLLMLCDMTVSDRSAHELFMLLADGAVLPVSEMLDEQAEHFLRALLPMENLDDYWVQSFLKGAVLKWPEKVVSLFKSRIERSIKYDNWSFRPVPHGSYRQFNFSLNQNEDGHYLIEDLLNWALGRVDDVAFDYRFGELIEAVCTPFDDGVVSIFKNWIELGGVQHIDVLASALREAPDDFVVSQKDFAIWLLRRCQAFGDEAVKLVSGRLYSCAVYGMRSGSQGEPFPADIKLRESAKAVLGEIGRFEPAYKLYADILRHAEEQISEQLEERRILDAEDEDA